MLRTFSLLSLFFLCNSVTVTISASETVVFNDPAEERDRRYIETILYKEIRKIELSSYNESEKISRRSRLYNLYLAYIDPDATYNQRMTAKKELCQLLNIQFTTSRPLSRANSDSGYASGKEEEKPHKNRMDYSLIDTIGKRQRAMKGSLNVTSRREKDFYLDPLNDPVHIDTLEKIRNTSLNGEKESLLTTIATKAKAFYSYFFGA